MDFDFSKVVGQGEPDFEVIVAALQSQIDPAVLTDADRQTTSNGAKDGNHYSTLRALLSAGGDPAAFGWTDIFLAVAFGMMEDLEEALTGKSDIEAVDGWGRTAFLLSIQVGHIEKTKLLLEAGANPMLRCMPNTTPAGLGEGHVPPALRDAMIAMAAEGVWLEDERKLKQEEHINDLYGGAQRPGERAAAGVGVSDRRLAELTAEAARMEREELDNRGRMSQEHVRIGWWTKRKPNRHARAPKRSTGSRSEVAMA